MVELSFPIIAAWTNVAVFAAAGLVNLAGISHVRRVYARWDIPPIAFRTIGLIQLFAAAFLAEPDMRVWGIILAFPIAFGAVIVLLNHRHYFYGTAVSLILVALVPAMLALPADHIHYTTLPNIPDIQTDERNS